VRTCGVMILRAPRVPGVREEIRGGWITVSYCDLGQHNFHVLSRTGVN
jgi:hypothetical protein